MNTYNVYWNGLDRGHESTWNPKLWRGVLNAFAKYSPVDLKDINGSFFTTLKTEFPGVQWVTGTRTFFRDGREAWHTTAVVKFPKGSDTASITGLGKKIVEGRVSYAEVLSATALQAEENGEHPFSILLDALRNAPGGRGLSVEDLIKVMRHYREGDDISAVLSLPNEAIPDTKLRRFKGILQLMVYAGLAIMVDGLYFAGQDASTFSKITGDDLRKEFIRWLNEENVVGSGKASSYEIALDDASLIAQKYCDRFKMPSVYEMPDSTLESLSDFIAAEAKKESEHPGSGMFCSLPGLHGISYWRDGYCSAAISELIRFKSNFREAKSVLKSRQALSSTDLLSVALKLFAEQRENDDNDGWFQSGRAVNGRIRDYFAPLTVAALTTFDDTKITELFCGTKGADGKVDLETMWSGKPGMGWSNIKPDTLTETDDIRDFLVKIKTDAGVAATFRQNGFKRPKGFGPSVISELLMKFHPEQCIKHGEVSHQVLSWFGLIDFAWNREYTENDYKQVCGAAAKLLARMKSMRLPRQINADGSEDSNPPDYLTVNEFIWFVNEKSKDIKNEVAKMAMKPADYSKSTNPPTEKKPKVNLANAEDIVLLRLASALRTKPFAILAGHSGTGKSRMVRKLAYMTCARGGYKALLEKDGKPLEKPGNFCMVQVKPNWHDSADLLGYYSELKSAFRTTDFVKFICKAYAYPDVPFFVCLDEMNLAPVEQYFAEYLSAIESRKIVDVETMDQSGVIKTEKGVVTDVLLDKEIWKDADKLGCEFTQSQHWVDKYGLTIPRNLFVVGTVNMDETTNQFSRKVLDRAFTLEMTDADFDHFGVKDPEPSFADYAGDDFVAALLDGKLQASELTTDHKLKPDQVAKLNALKPVLADTSFVVAYRFANEYALYEDSLATIIGKVDVEPSASGTSGAPAGTTPPTGGASSGTASPAAKPDAFDDVVLMKLLPRINGDDSLVLKIYTGKEDGKLDNAETQSLAGILGKKGASFDKMKEIVARGGSYLSFWP